MKLRTAKFCAVFAAALMGSAYAVAAPGADVYGALPGISSPVISPDGKSVVALVPRGNDTAVRIAQLGGKVCDYLPPDVKVRSAFWASPSRVAVAVSFYFAPENTSEGRRYSSEVSRYLTLDTNCGAGVELLRDHPDYARLAGFSYIGRTADSMLFEALTDGSRGADQGNRQPSRFDNQKRETFRLDVYKVDPNTGKSEKYETGKVGTAFWMADAAGNLKIRGDLNPSDRTKTIYARLDGSSDWTEVYREAASVPSDREIYFLGTSRRPDAAYVMTRNGGDKDAIYEFDFKTKSLGKQVFANARVDADGIKRDPYTRAPVGVSYTLDAPVTDYFDRTYAQHQADVEATFPGEHVQILSQSLDGNRYLAYVEGKENPGGHFHVIDTAASDISLVGKRYEALTAADLAPVRAYTYKARDGLDIPGYLTLPPGSTGKNLPLVIMPHGGPGARDDITFDAWSQFLATRGYAVLRPNFRGSTGYGARFFQAGRFQWGLKMQDDLTDGVKALIADGTVNKDKVCIFGWSYGGYAAMAGLAYTPEIYKCGAAGAGVSDLMALSGQIRRSSDASYLSGNSWRSYIGDPSTDAARLRSTSPVNAAGNIVAPLLLFHGRKDTTVLPAQSERMVDALDQKGKWVKLIMFEDEDHWIARNATGKRMLAELETFLAEHLKK